MPTLLALAALIPAAYSFPSGKTVSYEMSVALDGNIPILSGEEAKAELKLGVIVGGLEPDAEGRPMAYSDLSSLKVYLNGALLPFELDSIKGFFPKTTVSFSPLGKVLKSDAPDLAVPVRIPGLDVKRFPEISYLPLEFPVGGIEEGKGWAFKRPFNGVDMAYSAELKSVKENVAEIAVKLSQTYETLEDDAKQVVSDAKDATFRVVTDLKGSGTVWFDLAKGMATKVEVDTVALSKAEDLKTKLVSERRLDLRLRVKLAAPGPLP